MTRKLTDRPYCLSNETPAMTIKRNWSIGSASTAIPRLVPSLHRLGNRVAVGAQAHRTASPLSKVHVAESCGGDSDGQHHSSRGGLHEDNNESKEQRNDAKENACHYVDAPALKGVLQRSTTLHLAASEVDESRGGEFLRADVGDETDLAGIVHAAQIDRVELKLIDETQAEGSIRSLGERA